MSGRIVSRVLCGVFAGAAAFALVAPAANAAENEYLCSDVQPSPAAEVDVESCIYLEDGTPKAFGGLTVKTDAINQDSDCQLVVTVVDLNAPDGGRVEVANSGPLSCVNGRYPSPPLVVDSSLVHPHHRYMTVTEVTVEGENVARVDSPVLFL